MHLFLGIIFFTAVIIYFLDFFVFRRTSKWISITLILGITVMMFITATMHLILLGIFILIGGLFILNKFERPLKKKIEQLNN
jgi:hypothetical protein